MSTPLGNLPGDISGKSALSHTNSACTYGCIACTAGDRIFFRWACGRRPIHLSTSFCTSCLRISGAEPPHFWPVLALCAVFGSRVVSAPHPSFKIGTQAQQRQHATHATHATQVLRPRILRNLRSVRDGRRIMHANHLAAMQFLAGKGNAKIA